MNYTMVPKYYMKETDFEVDRYNFTSQRVIYPHNHDFYEIYLFITGKIDYFIDDHLYHLEPGDMVIVPPHVMHQPIILDADVPYDRFLLWVSPSAIEHILLQDSDLYSFLQTQASSIFLLRGDKEKKSYLLELFSSLLEVYQAKNLFYRSEMTALITTLLITTYRTHHENKSTLKDFSTDTQLISILQFIHNHLSEPLTLDAIATAFLMSRASLSRLFTKHLGISFYQYILQRRLLLSRELLISGKQASKVYELCGFSDYSCFYRAFKKRFGEVPSAYKMKK